MIGREEDTSYKRQYASYRGLRKKYPLHLSEIGAALYFLLPQTKTGAYNRRYGLRHCNRAKTSTNWRTTNQRHGICHCDGVKNSSTWRTNLKKTRFQRTNPPLYSCTRAPNRRTINRRHGICHRDGSKHSSIWRTKFKEPRYQRPNPPLYPRISATSFIHPL